MALYDSYSDSPWLSQALTGSLWLLLALSLSLSSSLWLSVTPNLAPTGSHSTLWLTLALSGSLLLSNFAYTVLDQLSWPLLGSQRRCHADALYPSLIPASSKTNLGNVLCVLKSFQNIAHRLSSRFLHKKMGIYK